MADGTGATFRQFLADMLTISVRMTALRERFAVMLGISGPQYQMLMAIAQEHEAGGVSVRAVARHLHVSGAFVTAEVRKLVEAGLVAKDRNREDRRGVLLRLTAKGETDIADILQVVRTVNEFFFGVLRPGEFEKLASFAGRLVAGSDMALAFADGVLSDIEAA